MDDDYWEITGRIRLNTKEVGSTLKIYIIIVESAGSELSSPTIKDYPFGSI